MSYTATRTRSEPEGATIVVWLRNGFGIAGPMALGAPGEVATPTGLVRRVYRSVESPSMNAIVRHVRGIHCDRSGVLGPNSPMLHHQLAPS